METSSVFGRCGIPVMGMGRGRLYSLNPEDDNRAMIIRCLKGTLWITQAGDERDHVLRRGDMFSPLRIGLVVVQSVEKSFLQIGRIQCFESGRFTKGSINGLSGQAEGAGGSPGDGPLICGVRSGDRESG